MHRTHLGGLLAVALPGALTLHPGLGVVVGCGLVSTFSLTAWVAALVSLVVLWPDVWPFAVGGLMVAILLRHLAEARHWIQPGSIGDSVRSRLLTWLYLVQHLTWRGHRWGSTRLACEAAHIRSHRLAMDGGPARNEFLSLLYEWGLGGAALCGTGVSIYVATFHWSSALSAAASSALVVACTTSPLTALAAWLRGGRAGRIFGPPLKASLTVHLDATGHVHLFGGKDLVGNRPLQIEVARAFFNVGHTWMQEHQLTLEEVQG